MNYQTAPTKDDLLFAPAASVTIAAGLTTTSILQDSSDSVGLMAPSGR